MDDDGDDDDDDDDDNLPCAARKGGAAGSFTCARVRLVREIQANSVHTRFRIQLYIYIIYIVILLFPLNRQPLVLRGIQEPWTRDVRQISVLTAQSIR